MQRAALLLIVATFILSGTALRAEPPSKTERPQATRKTTDRSPSRSQLIESANGWMFVKGEWIHPDGYKFLNNQIIRTTARPGKSVPKPPGKLALENPTKLAPSTRPATPPAKDDAKTAADKAAEARRKNLEPRPAPQTGSHL